MTAKYVTGPGNRARDVARILSRIPSKKFQQGDSAQLLAAKNALFTIAPGKMESAKDSAPEVGLRRLSAAELSVENLRAYEHSAFRISYPANWEIVGEKNSSLTMYPKAGADRETVAYGTMVSAFTPGGGAKELGEATRQLITSIPDTNPPLRQSGNPKNVTVGGRAAKSVELLGNSAIREKGQPVAERIRLVAVQAKGSLIRYLVFVAPDADFDLIRPVFERILRSFAPR